MSAKTNVRGLHFRILSYQPFPKKLRTCAGIDLTLTSVIFIGLVNGR